MRQMPCDRIQGVELRKLKREGEAYGLAGRDVWDDRDSNFHDMTRKLNKEAV
jgi:hypothetical protein